jgi:6-phosphogluconolactonase (cycloisomerase 2 family)
MRIARAIVLTAAVAACSTDRDSARQFPLSPIFDQTSAVVGQVYTMSNQAVGNAVLVYNRSSDGSLTGAGSYPTGGLGTGGGLGNQSGVTLDEAAKTLIVVNAGSNEVSAFRVNGDGSLTLTDKAGSGGSMPISVTISNDAVYVLNAGGSGNIAGFRLSSQGDLDPIAGSTRPLSTSSAGPAQIAFDPNGKRLVVTEKANNVISTYAVDNQGVASGPTVTPASGVTPFGFGFTRSGTLVVSEAFGGAPNGSALSSYAGNDDGTWSVITGSVPTTETSACWVVVTNSGRFAYATNAASGTISGFAIHQGGLTLLDANGVTGNLGAGSGPSDMAVSRDGKFLYALAGGSHRIAGFAIGADGSLTPLSGWPSGLPTGDNGLAAR